MKMCLPSLCQCKTQYLRYTTHLCVIERYFKPIKLELKECESEAIVNSYVSYYILFEAEPYRTVIACYLFVTSAVILSKAEVILGNFGHIVNESLFCHVLANV